MPLAVVEALDPLGDPVEDAEADAEVMGRVDLGRFDVRGRIRGRVDVRPRAAGFRVPIPPTLPDGVAAGFDVVFDTTGHRSGVETAVDHVRKGGEIVVVGLPAASSDIFFTPVVRGEVCIKTSYGSTWQDFEHAVRLIESGDIDFDAIVDTSYSIKNPAAAFEAFLNAETCKPIFSFKDL